MNNNNNSHLYNEEEVENFEDNIAIYNNGARENMNLNSQILTQIWDGIQNLQEKMANMRLNIDTLLDRIDEMMKAIFSYTMSFFICTQHNILNPILPLSSLL